jgi:hypothetical protein
MLNDTCFQCGISIKRGEFDNECNECMESLCDNCTIFVTSRDGYKSEFCQKCFEHIEVVKCCQHSNCYVMKLDAEQCERCKKISCVTVAEGQQYCSKTWYILYIFFRNKKK